MTPQSSIAHYRITAKLGEGGMGEVWRATDTRLNRDVAIKILPPAFAQDPDRMARFTREAHVLASLNHPNIAAIYGVEERALVMELVEGPTLAERIAQGAMPVEEVLPVLHQIVDALEYAHEKGVVHRDLKPANIKITPEGRVKVLDFGLAKALTNEPAADDPASSPTLTMRATMAGVIMGTAGYMAPEQARGHNVDKRADIWAFGVVAYEMLTGRQLFTGPTISDTLAAVLKEEPAWDRVPEPMRRLLRLCLMKDPRQRLRDIGDARILLDQPQLPDAPMPVRRPSAVSRAVAAAALLIAAALGFGLWRATRPVDHPLLSFRVDLGPDAVAGVSTTAVLSPDGTRVVFPSRGSDGRTRLSVRLLSQLKTTPLSGTESATDPFFSPEGEWIGFFADGKMKKISATGGAAVSLCDASGGRGGSWGQDGHIIAARNAGGLFRVPEAGGTPQQLTKPAEGETTHRWPQILPGGQAVLFTAHTAGTGFDAASIALLSLKTGQWKTVYRGGYCGRYLPSGYLVYIHEGTLFGVPFDPDRGEIQGNPAPLLEEVAANSTLGGGQFDFSRTGTLVYLSGKSIAASHSIVWMDSAGKTEALVPTPGDYIEPRISPDGKRLALIRGGAPFGDIWVYDLERDTPAKITFTAQYSRPVWTPDGKHLVYESKTDTEFILGWMRADGAGEPQRLLKSKDVLLPTSFSPDGRRLVYADVGLETGPDIWTLPLDASDPDRPKPGKPEPFLLTAAVEVNSAFSPDGRWIAYQSNETGAYEVYVRPFPGPGGKWQISSDGGGFPVWSRDGRELLYETPDGHIMAAGYTARGDSLAVDKVRPWSNQPVLTTSLQPNFDLSPDGKRVVAFPLPQASAETKASLHVIFLLNWFDDVRRRMPVAK